MSRQNWAALGRAIRLRREQLGMTQMEVSRAGGPSDVTISRLESGQGGTYRRLTFDALERALRWKPGAVDAILADEEPVMWELEEPKGALVSDWHWVPEVTSAGLGFLSVLDKHCAADHDAAAIRQTVLPFIKKINEGAR